MSPATFKGVFVLAAAASAAAAATAAATEVVAATAAAQDEDDDNDPPATTVAKTIVEHIHVLHSAAAPRLSFVGLCFFGLPSLSRSRDDPDRGRVFGGMAHLPSALSYAGRELEVTRITKARS